MQCGRSVTTNSLILVENKFALTVIWHFVHFITNKMKNQTIVMRTVGSIPLDEERFLLISHINLKNHSQISTDSPEQINNGHNWTMRHCRKRLASLAI